MVWRAAFSFISCVLFALGAGADLGADEQKALEQTQQLLRDQQQRDGALKASPQGQLNHQELQKTVGAGENTNAVYGMSADIFGVLVKETNGNPELLHKRMLEAQKDPEAFLRSLPPELRAKIKALSDKVEGSRAPTAKP